MKAVGVVFSNIHDKYISELTRLRTLGSVPFAGRYRLIDFALSNMVNAGIDKVGVITKSNYQSLMDHIGSGKDWDLSRKNGGIMLLPPFGASESNALYKTRLDALKGITSFLNKSTEDYVIMSDCDKVFNIDLSKVLKEHIKTRADITVVYKDTYLDRESSLKNTIYTIDENKRIKWVVKNPGTEGRYNVCLNVIVLKKQLLLDSIMEAITYEYESFHKDILGQFASSLNIRGYQFEGYFAAIDSLSNYYIKSLEMLEKANRDAIFGIKERPVYTKVSDSAPARYYTGSKSQNSLIADGCEIYGEVSNSIIFRNVYIGKGSVVKNSIIMQNTFIGENITVDSVITDKNAVLKNIRMLNGCKELPYYIPKNIML